MKNVFLPCIYLLFVVFSSDAQQLDSLKRLLQNNSRETEKVELLNEICKAYWYSDTDSAEYFCQLALDISTEINDSKGAATSYYNLGVVQRVLGNYDLAISRYYQSIKLCVELDDLPCQAASLNGLGVIHKIQNNHNKALEHFFKALEIVRNDNIKTGLASVQNNIGEVFMSKGKYDSALIFCKRSLGVRYELEDVVAISKSLNNLGEIFRNMNEYDSAHHYFESALQYSIKGSNLVEESQALLGLASLSLSNGQYNQSLMQAENALAKATKEKARLEKLEAYDLLKEGYYAKGDYFMAFMYLTKHTKLNDSLFNEEKAKEINRLRLTRQEQENEALTKANRIQELTIEKQKSRNLAILIIALLVGISLLVIYRFYIAKLKAFKKLKEKNDRIAEQNSKLNELNEEITVQNESINEQKTQLEEANKLKDKLISMISHDVRSPLNNFQSMINLSKVSALSSEEFKEWIPKVESNLSSIQNFMNNLLYWAKARIHEHGINRTKVNIYNLVVANLKLHQPQINNKGLKIQNDIDVSVMVYADKEMINIVIKNIISNAVKFTPTDNKIYLYSELGSNPVRIVIKNTGSYIEEEYIDQLFDFESNYSTSGTIGEKGTGIGLAFCKEFVEDNNGKIWVESSKQYGTTFSFTLPLAK